MGCKIKLPENEEDYYLENGLVVFTEVYHIKKGKCCGRGCRHCPYKVDMKNYESGNNNNKSK